jgi:hypothetical protein
MAISAKLATSIKNAFVAANGMVEDMHNGGAHGDIKLDGLVVAKDLEGNILRIGGHLINKTHCINRVTLADGKVVLTTDSISAGMYDHQATSPEAVVMFLNDNEKFMAEEIFKCEQTTFWSVL